jgi:predicted nucleic acid-binding protein
MKCYTARKEHGEEPCQKVSSRFDVLIDSDAFIGRFYPSDPHFQKASATFAALAKQGAGTVTTSMVVAETATVLSHRQGQELACMFLQKIQESKIPVIHIDEALQDKAIKLFMAQNKKGTSFVDCANVTVMRQLSIPTIFSFDEVYSKKFGLRLAQAETFEQAA